MRILFRLAWFERSRSLPSAFKSVHACSLFTEYAKRISRFTPCQVSGARQKDEIKSPGTKIWVCEKNLSVGAGLKPAPTLSSEDLAVQLRRLLNSGARQLEIWIGGPDGFSRSELEALKPDLKWSFGPLTFPHELAAVIAGEQIYRAFTIFSRLPYHTGH